MPRLAGAPVDDQEVSAEAISVAGQLGQQAAGNAQKRLLSLRNDKVGELRGGHHVFDSPQHGETAA